ncbi:MAG TPA: exosortase/archaeosortase family protein [Chthoniobacterales bacterium]|nr:exosortase/archaeosortase family protein [Chthoniobacterales bacterium]
MDATSSPSLPATTAALRVINWFPIAVFALVWVELISRLRFEWSINPQYGYGWTVPFLTAYIFWRRSQNTPAPSAPAVKIIPGLVIVLAAAFFVPVRLIQEANPDWRLLSWAMALSAGLITAAGVYLAGGARWLRHFAFPILFFFVAVPWPTNLEQFVIQGLMRIGALINVEVLNAIDIPAVQMGNVIEIGSGFVGIDEACTGIRSLQATFMVSLFLGEFYEFTAWRRFILVVSGAVLAFGCNLVRTFLLVWLSAERGPDAIKTWHDPAGHTILVVCLFALWGMSMFLRGKEQDPSVASGSRPGFRVPRLVLGCLLALILVAEGATQIWYRSHESRTARLQPWTITWPSEATSWKTVPIADAAQELLRYNEGGGGTWTGNDGHLWNMFFFRWLPGRTAGLFVKNHRPDICLPASGMKQRGGVQSKLLTVNGVALPIRFYIFDNNGRSLHVFYCYWDGTSPRPGMADHENWTAAGRLDAVRKGKRDVGTQMLEIVGWDYESDEKAEQAAVEHLSKIVRPG